MWYGWQPSLAPLRSRRRRLRSSFEMSRAIGAHNNNIQVGWGFGISVCFLFFFCSPTIECSFFPWPHWIVYRHHVCWVLRPHAQERMWCKSASVGRRSIIFSWRKRSKDLTCIYIYTIHRTHTEEGGTRWGWRGKPGKCIPPPAINSISTTTDRAADLVSHSIL